MFAPLMAAAAGAAAAYFFDPTSGNRRRAIARDKIASFFRRGADDAAGYGKVAAGHARGMVHEVPAPFRRDEAEYDDATLAAKVESEMFRGIDVDKGKINVSVEHGFVVLVGEVDRPELVQELGAAARRVDGVRGVDNLLHMPGAPAPPKHHMAEAR